MYFTKSLIGVALLLFAGNAFGQTIVVESPVLVPAQPQVVYYSPTVVAPVASTPIVSSRTVWYSPSATMVAPSAPVASTFVGPVTVGYPSTVVGAPVTVYRPTVAAYPTYVIGRGSIGQPTLYVPGQPIRNTLRYFSP